MHEELKFLLPFSKVVGRHELGKSGGMFVEILVRCAPVRNVSFEFSILDPCSTQKYCCWVARACRRARTAPPNMAMAAATAGRSTTSSVDQVKMERELPPQNLL